MQSLSQGQTLGLLLALGVLLGSARVLGEIARRLHQPSLLGEILAGVLLGPTLLGRLVPGFEEWLFPMAGPQAFALSGFSNISIALFLLVAGMEVDLSTVWKQGKPAMWVGLTGVVVPFALGALAVVILPDLFEVERAEHRELYVLFLATAFSISALPVIAKTLLDLHLFKSEFGMVVIAAAVLNDLVGWLIFAVILGQYEGSAKPDFDVGNTLWLTLGFTAFVLTALRASIHRVLPWVQAHTSFPAGLFALAISLGFMGAAFTEWIGVHAIFGAFLVGVALGDSRHLRERTRATLHEFTSAIFAPVFFATLGLRFDFIANFDATLCLTVVFVATLGKLVGCGGGALIGGLGRREAMAVAATMNSRGAMEMILGLVALQAGLIGERIFVALIVMALVTTMSSGPILQALFGRRAPRRVGNYLARGGFVPRLIARDRKNATEELCRILAEEEGLPFLEVREAVWNRERLAPTGVGQGIAVPHARLDALTEPRVALGFSEDGIDFDAPDGKPAQIVFLVLTPREDDGAQLELLADIGRTFAREETRRRLLAAQGFTEVLAVLRMEWA